METPSWAIYTTAAEAWKAMLEACETATESIDLEQFIFYDDEIGRKFIEVCAKKAAEGVRVRFLWDAAGSFSFFGTGLVSELSARGIQVAFFNTIIPRTLHTTRWWFFRNHRRSLIIDSKLAFTGSYCIYNVTRHWRDTSISITGGVVKQISDAFLIMWNRAQGIKVNWGNDKAIASGGFHYCINIPLVGRHHAYLRLIEAIRGAKKSILLTTPYFVPDHRLLRVIRLAARRGVNVQLLVPQSSDHPVVDLGGRSFFSSLLRAKVKIYQYTPTFIHTKTVVIDDDWASIGTMNLDSIGLRYNFEANIVTTNHLCVQTLRKQFENDLRHSQLITREIWDSRPIRQKWLEIFVRPLKIFL